MVAGEALLEREGAGDDFAQPELPWVSGCFIMHPDVQNHHSPERETLHMSATAHSIACTALTYQDVQGRTYLGRTLELTSSLPYHLVYWPRGQEFASRAGTQPALLYRARLASLCVTMPGRVPRPQTRLTLADLKVVEGFNEAGLTFSLLAYPDVSDEPTPSDGKTPTLAATDLGTWALGRFEDVDEVRAALESTRVWPDAVALLGGTPAPFHYLICDRAGKALVLEFQQGCFHVYDNPVGVLTNGPEFPWHLTNLANYTFLSNVDRSAARFGRLQLNQPDSGIATASLPSSSTSVGRFVRAVFYREFAEKVADPDDAIRTLAHIMNNFDRPKGISVSPPTEGGPLEVRGLSEDGKGPATEFTSWTNLTDLERRRIFLRTYDGLNYTAFDLPTLVAAGSNPRILPLQTLDGLAPDGTGGMNLLP